MPSTDCAPASSWVRVVSLPTRLDASGRCAAQLNPLTPSTTVGSVAASVSVTTPGVPDGDVRAAGPDRRRPREDLVARVREHGEQRPALDLGVPRRPVRVGPPLERRTARVGGVARGVRRAHLREQVGASRRDGGHRRSAEREHADEQAEHEATQHRGVGPSSGRAHPGFSRRATGTLGHNGTRRGRAGRVRTTQTVHLTAATCPARAKRLVRAVTRTGRRARSPVPRAASLRRPRRRRGGTPAWPARAPAGPPRTRRPSRPPSRPRRRPAGPTAGSRALRHRPASTR